MATGLTYDDDPIYRTSEDARAGLPVYGGVNQADLPQPPRRMALTAPPPQPPVPEYASPAPDPMIAAGYTPVAFDPPTPGSPIDIGEKMRAAGYSPVTFDTPPDPNRSRVAAGFQQQWLGTKAGGIGLVGALAHSAGATSVEDWARKAAAENEQQTEALGTTSFSAALGGEEGASWGNFAKELGGAALEVLAEGAATAAATAAVGSVIPGAGTVAGGATGFVAGTVNAVARNAVFQRLMGRAITFEGKKLAEAAAAQGLKVTEQQVAEQASRNVLKYAAVGAAIDQSKNTGVEIGTIFNDAVEESEKTGKPVDMAKVYGYGLGAGLMETVGDLAGVGKFLGEGKAATRLGNAARAMLSQSLTEGGTEGVQTILERIGASQNDWANVWTDPAARRDIIDSMAAGAGIGGIIGGAGGVTHRGHKAGTPKDEIGEADLPDVTLGRKAGAPLGLPAPGGTVPPPGPGEGRAGGLRTPGMPTEVATTDAEAQNEQMWQARDAESARLAALHDTGEQGGDARADVAAAVAELTGAAQGALNELGARPGILQTVGKVKGETEALAPKGRKRGLQPPETPAVASAAPGAPVTTNAEPQSDIKAQIAAMADPSNPKDSVFVAKGTPLPKGVPAGVLRINKPEGVYLTTNREKAATITALPTVDEQARADFLGIPDGKPTVAAKAAGTGNPPIVVTGKDKAGNVVAQAATHTPASANTAAVTAQTPAGGTVHVQTTQEALGERAAKVAGEVTNAAGRTLADVETDIRANRAAQEANTDPTQAKALQAKYYALLDEWSPLHEQAQNPTVAPTVETPPATPKTKTTKATKATKVAPVAAVVTEAPAPVVTEGKKVSAAEKDSSAKADKLEAEAERIEYAQPAKDEDPSVTAAKRWIVDAINGDIPAEFAVERLRRSGLPPETLASITAEPFKEHAAVFTGDMPERVTQPLKKETLASGRAKVAGKKIEVRDAVQVAGTAGVLQPAQKPTGKAGGGRGRVEQGKQGKKPAAPVKAATQTTEPEEVAPTITVAGFDANGEGATLHVWVDGDKLTRAEVVHDDGSTLVVATKRKDTLASVLNRVEEVFMPGQKLAEEKEEKDTRQNHEAARNAGLKALRDQVRRKERGTPREIAQDASDAEREAFVNQKLETEFGLAEGEKSITFVETPSQYTGFVETVKALLGQNVQFWSPANKEARESDGFVVKGDPDTIYVSINNENPHAEVIGHEIGHNIRAQNPKLWADFMKALLPLIDQKQFEKYLIKLNKKLKAEAKRNGRSQPSLADVGAIASDEVSADALGSAFMDPEFWKMMGNAVPEEQKPLVVRMASEVAGMLGRFLTAIRKLIDPNVKPSPQRAAEQKMFTDMQKVNRAVRDLIIAHNSENETPPTYEELSKAAGVFYDAKMDPDPAEGQRAWADLSERAQEDFTDSYDLYKQGDITWKELERDFLQINQIERGNAIKEARTENTEQTKARQDAEEIWDKLAKKNDPDFDELSGDHKNYFIRAVYDSERGKQASPTSAYEQIMRWRDEAEVGVSKEQKRTDRIAAREAKEKAQKDAAEAEVIAAREKEKARLDDIASLVAVSKKSIEKRLRELTDREKEVVARFYGRPLYDNNIERRFRTAVMEALVDPQRLVRAVPGKIRPIVRRVIGNALGSEVKFSRVGMRNYTVDEFDSIDVESAKFQRWFGDSKIVDENGQPKVMYHGTAFDIQAFKRGAAGAIFLTDDPNFTSQYAEDQARLNADKGGAPVVYPLYVRAENPFDFDNPKHINTVMKSISGNVIDMFNDIRDANEEPHLTPEEERHVLAETRYELKLGLWNMIEEDHVQEAIRDAGFDSFYVHESGHKNLAVMSSNQLKSAVSNTGDYGADTRISFKRKANPMHEGPMTEQERAALDAAHKYLSPAEAAKLRGKGQKSSDRLALSFLDAIGTMPDMNEMAAIAWAGRAKRGWYENSMKAIHQVFGMDAPRFTALLAATSPQTSVEDNTLNALNIWKDWTKAGRPTGRKAIINIVAGAVQKQPIADRPNAALNSLAKSLDIDVGAMSRAQKIATLEAYQKASVANRKEVARHSVLEAWENNAVRALQAEHPTLNGFTLSGPKVDSFFRNLMGDMEQVTNDAWMAGYALVDQDLFAGKLGKGGTEPGKGPGYLAMNVRAREAAKLLSERTGDKWTPAEVQETIWAWAKTLYEKAEEAGVTATDFLNDGKLTDELITATVDFRSLFADERQPYQGIIRDAGLTAGLARLTAGNAERAAATESAPVAGTAGQASPFAGRTQARHERSAAAGLTYLYTKRLQDKAEKRAAMRARKVVEARDAEVKFSRKDMLNPIEIYALRGDKIVGMATFNIPNQTWAVFKALPGGDIRVDYTEGVATDTADAINQLREKGVRLVRRKNSPVTTSQQNEGFHDAWARGPDTLFDLDTSAQPSNNWFVKKADAALSKLGVSGPEARKFLQKQYQDAYIDVKMLLRDIAQKGGVISAANNVYQKITLFSGQTGERLEGFKRKFSDPLEAKITEAIQKGATMKDIEAFLIAQHAEERNKFIEQRTQGKKTDGSGVATDVANRRLAAYANAPYHAELQEIGRIADGISAFKVNLMESSGLISTDTANGMRGAYKHYRPLKGKDDDDSLEITGGIGVGTGFSGKGSLLKYALGRDTEAQHTISHMLLDAEAKIVRAGKNDVAKSLAQLARDFPDPKFWTLDEMKARQIFNPETGAIRYYADNGAMNPNIVTAFTNGVATQIELKNDDFAEAMTNAKAAGTNGAIELLRRWNKYLAMMMTSMNPEWGIINMFRDAQTAFFNIASDSRLPPGIGKAVMKELLALKGHGDIYKAITAPDNPTGLGTYYRELEQQGGITKFFGMENLADRAKKLADMEQRVQNKGFTGKLRAVYEKSHMDGMIQFMEDANSMIEAAPRVIMYKALVERGWSKADAADYAKNLTVNFNRRGADRFASSLYLFFNPAIQGTARLATALQSPAGKGVALSLFGLGVAASMMGNSGGDDDKNGIPDYQQLSDGERATNIILWPHGPKVPLPYGWNAFYAMGNFLTDAFFGRSPMDSAWSGLKASLNAFNPVGGADSKNVNNWLLKNIAPTFVDPFLAWGLNENQFGSQIYRAQDTRFGPKMPDSASGSFGASAGSKAIASGLNTISGGSAAQAGALDVSPDTLDHIFANLFPGIASSSVRAASTVKKLVSDEPTETREYPGIRRVWTEPSKGRVWEELQSAKQEIGEFQNVQKNGTPEDRAALAKEHPNWGGVAAGFQAFGKMVGDLQRRKAAIIDGKIKVADETAEKAKIDERILMLNNKMLKAYNDNRAKWP